MKKASGNHGDAKVVTSLRMSREEHDALKALAERESRTVSGQLRHVIKTMVAQVSEPRKAA